MKSNDHYGAISSTTAAVPPTAPPMEQPRETVAHVQGGAPEHPSQLQEGQQQQTNQGQPPQPPPYNEAINYPPMPAAPPYPVYQPNTFPSVAGIAPHMPQMMSTNGGLGAGMPIYMMPAAPPMPTIVNTTTVVPPQVHQPPARVNPCAHCPHGVVHSEADYCCLFCLLFFAVISFPFGLVLLLFIPLAFRRRCSACRHLYT